VLNPVLEHVVDGGEHGGGDGADRFLGAAPCFQPVELGAVIAIFLFDRRPCRLDHGGLEPGGALAQSRGLLLAGALVLAGTEARPGDEVTGRREAVMSVPISERMVTADWALIPGMVLSKRIRD